MKILFAGTGQAAFTVIEFLIRHIQKNKYDKYSLYRISICALITKTLKSYSKSNYLFNLLHKHDIDLIITKNINEKKELTLMKKYNADLGIIISYGVILSQKVLKITKLGWINVHFSLLPHLRGAAPVEHAILKQYEYTGITIFRINKGLDSGPIVSRIKEKIYITDTSQDLINRLTAKACLLLKKNLYEFSNRKIHINHLKPQFGTATFAPKIQFSDGRINWHQSTKQVIHHIKAMTPKPGAWTFFYKQLIKIWIFKNPYFNQLFIKKDLLIPGKIYMFNKHLYVSTKDSLITIFMLQPSGKKIMSAYSWSLGNLLNYKLNNNKYYFS